MTFAILGQVCGVPLFYTLRSGQLATLYAQKFGAGDFMVGVVNGVLMLGMLASLLLPDIVERFNKRRVLLTSLAASIIVFLPMLFIPWVASATSNRIALLVLTVSLLAHVLMLCGQRGTWFPILHDFLPSREIGRFFGRLRVSWQSASIGLFLVFSLMVSKDAPVSRFQIFLAVLLFGASLRLVFHTQLPQKPVAASGTRGPRARIRQMMSDRAFARFTFFSMVAGSLTLWMAPTLVIYAKLLDVSDRLVVLLMLTQMVSRTAGFSVWGRMADREGLPKLYRWGFSLIAAGFAMWLPISYLARAQGNPQAALAWMFVSLAVLAVGESAVNIAITHHSFKLTPSERAPSYLTFQPVFMSASTGLGIMILGATFGLTQAADSKSWLNPYVIGFSATAILALALMATIRRLPYAQENPSFSPTE